MVRSFTTTMTDIRLSLDINLETFTTNRIAEALWETPKIKNEIKKFATNVYNSKETIIFNEGKWRYITRKIQTDIKTLPLPNELVQKLDLAVVFIGDRIFFWLVHVISEHKFNVKYFDKIYWTPHGVIDNWKIYQTWIKDPNFPGFSDVYKSKMRLYCTASIYADENLIRQNLPEIARLIGRFTGLKIKDHSRFKVNSAISILLIWYITGFSVDTEFDEEYSQLKSEEYPNGTDKLFLHCMLIGLLRCAEYFYKKLKENDKERVLNKAALECLNSDLFNVHMPVTERMPEILLYLLGKMSRERKKEFLVEHINDVYRIFSNTWPYQQLCAPLLDYVWGSIALSKKFTLLETTLTTLCHFVERRHAAYESAIYQPMLQNLLPRFPKAAKLRFFLNCDAIFELFKSSAYSTINIILDDEDLSSARSRILDISPFMTDYFEEGGTSKNLKEYITKMKLSAAQQKNLFKFSKKSNLLNFLIYGGRFDDAEDVLKWRYGSNEEKVKEAKQKMQKQFDSVKMCSSYIDSGNYKSAEKYLNFMYGNDSEAREKLFTEEFIRDKFLTLWMLNRKAPRKVCTNFLKIFFKTQEELKKFKCEKLVQNDFISKIFEASENYSPDFDEILGFCEVPPEKITDIKLKVRDAMYWYLTIYGGQPKKFLALDSLVNWVCDSEREKKIVKSKFTNHSSKAIVLAFFFTKCYDAPNDEYQEARKILLLEWVKPYGDVDSMKYMMSEVKGKDGVNEMDVERTMDMLDLCKNNSYDLLSQCFS